MFAAFRVCNMISLSAHNSDVILWNLRSLQIFNGRAINNINKVFQTIAICSIDCFSLSWSKEPSATSLELSINYSYSITDIEFDISFFLFLNNNLVGVLLGKCWDFSMPGALIFFSAQVNMGWERNHIQNSALPKTPRDEALRVVEKPRALRVSTIGCWKPPFWTPLIILNTFIVQEKYYSEIGGGVFWWRGCEGVLGLHCLI